VRHYDGSAWLSLPVGLACAVAAAHGLYLCVERPTHQLARRIGARKAPSDDALATTESGDA